MVNRVANTLLVEHRGKSTPFSLNGEQKEITYLTRIDPLSGHVSKISEERAARRIGISVNIDLKPLEKCDFCDFAQQTLRQRVEHQRGTVSVPNKYPWEKYDWITPYPPFGQHKMLLSGLYFEDMECMVESSYDLAAICAEDPDVLGFIDFTNWGAFAGASQQHPHSQRKSLTFAPDPRQEQEMNWCREVWRRYGHHPFDMLAEEELEQGSRVIHCQDVFIASAFAPTCPDEVIVFPRYPLANVLQTTSHDRRTIICPVLGVFPALFFYRGITDLNIAVHMAPFRQMEEARSYYRWHMHIYPRRPRLPSDRAGAEIGFELNVIDTLPENSAAVIRDWYRQGPREESLARLSNWRA
jgi:galactose-1-phosphate uridylyltransferase